LYYFKHTSLLINGEDFKLRVMTSIVTCTISNILSCFDMSEFIKL
jgi:hypothetical protein